ncbi:MAG: hypothetical protein QOJ39_1561 [Candidatus Eremiobacteraeota bacterium]|nr:hypothetical protein [Candidatus Eremiobacteraeota bacterium]MEA2719697.1 hypothetical protein [Candidatus Eremiobacteraeota bacterium]
MTNLGSGGEAKASPADREDTNPVGPADDVDVDQTSHGGTMDTALGANEDPSLPAGNDDGTGTSLPRVGQGETAAYGETIENAPGPTAGGGSSA